jgi:ABC-type glycerol-3-phosphate transport system substrate-binding protein
VVGRHTRAPASAPSVRRAPRFAILAFAVVGLLLAIGGVAVSRIGSGAAGDGCGPAAIRVQVTASPDIEPVLDRIAADFAATDVRFDGRCVAVDVGPGDPADVSAVLSGIRAGERPDVWIPDSCR